MTGNFRIDFEKSRAALRDILLRRMPEQGSYQTSVPAFATHRFHCGEAPKPRFYDPAVMVVVQGRKRIRLGSQDLTYGENTCFIAGTTMPATSCVMEASVEKPYLSMALKLDKGLIATLAAKTPPSPSATVQPFAGAAVQEMGPELLDAFLRLLELEENPEQVAVLGPLIYQEIHYRLLSCPFGAQLRALNTLGSQGHQITRAISWMRENYKESLQVEKLAEQLNMATSTFHKHFKEITTLSPLQYQKQLRLSEAQRLMLAADYDVTQAAFAVGYESPTQFNREYKRLFGESPRKDVMKIKGMAAV